MGRMKINVIYEVISKKKMHTKPLRFATCVQYGRYVKTTKYYYVFDTFRVKKNLIEAIQEKWSV